LKVLDQALTVPNGPGGNARASEKHKMQASPVIGRAGTTLQHCPMHSIVAFSPRRGSRNASIVQQAGMGLLTWNLIS
jgi:hypothetical protein